MQRIHRSSSRSHSMVQRLCLGGFSLLLASAMALAVQSNTLSEMMAEAADTYLTVTWYLKGGYWRDDARIYLTHAEFLFFPTSGIESRLEFDGDE